MRVTDAAALRLGRLLAEGVTFCLSLISHFRKLPAAAVTEFHGLGGGTQ